MKNLTVLVGSGASIELGVPSTKDITTALTKLKCNFPIDPNMTTNFIDELLKELKQYYSEPNFEHILEVIQEIQTLERSWNAKFDKFRTAEGFLTENPRQNLQRFFNDLALIDIQNQFFLELNKIINISSEAAKYSPHWKCYSQFWNQLNDRFYANISTLNYDTLIESACPQLIQGFEPVADESALRFNPRIFASSKRQLGHLHGSIQFGYRRGNPNRFIFADQWDDLYFYQNTDEASHTWGYRSSHTAQSGREAIISPIITGLAKPDKVLTAEPYQSYYRNLASSLLSNENLLVIGYGFSDLYINSLIQRMTSWHGYNRKIVLIGWKNREEWIPCRIWPRCQENEFNSIAKWTEEQLPLDTLTYEEPFISKNGLVRIYYSGMMSTIINHSQEIFAFFNN